MFNIYIKCPYCNHLHTKEVHVLDGNSSIECEGCYSLFVVIWTFTKNVEVYKLGAKVDYKENNKKYTSSNMRLLFDLWSLITKLSNDYKGDVDYDKEQLFLQEAIGDHKVIPLLEDNLKVQCKVKPRTIWSLLEYVKDFIRENINVCNTKKHELKGEEFKRLCKEI